MIIKLMMTIGKNEYKLAEIDHAQNELKIRTRQKKKRKSSLNATTFI